MRCRCSGARRCGAGDRIAGPAVVEEAASVTIVNPGQLLTVDPFGHLIIDAAGCRVMRSKRLGRPQRRAGHRDARQAVDRVMRSSNLSGDPEQDYFADGLVDDVITALSACPLVLRHRQELVVSPTSVKRSTRGRSVRELGVRYVLEGSVRKAGGRCPPVGAARRGRVGSFISGPTGSRECVDIFELQDRITESVVGAIELNLRIAEI